MSDEAPGGDAPGVGPGESLRVRESTAVTSGAEATQPSAADDDGAGAGEAAPVSSGGEPGVVGEGGEDTSKTNSAVASAPARADDEVDDEPLNMLSFIKVVTQEWPQELKDELARTPDNFFKIRDRLGLRDFCCGTCERPHERKIVD